MKDRWFDKGFLIYLSVAYITAFLMETIGRAIFTPNEQLWNLPNWIASFLIWYGLIFTIAYIFFKDKAIKHAVIYGIIVGIIAEWILFKKLNVLSFFLFIIGYGILFYIPFKFLARYNARRQMAGRKAR